MKNKVYSIYLGVTGMGVLSQFSTLLNFFNFLLPLGFPIGITKHVAQNKKLDPELLESVVKILLYPAATFFIILFFFSSDVSQLLFGNDTYSSYVKLTCIFVPFIITYNIIEAYVKGIKDITLYVKALIFSSVLMLLFSIPLTYYFSLYGALIGLLVNYVSFISILFFFLLKRGLRFKISLRKKINKVMLLDISKISFAVLLAGTLHQITIMIIKRFTIVNFGVDGNGLFQSVFNISIFYFGFIFTSLSSYSFPKISEMKNDKDLVAELNNTIRFILIVFIPLVSLLLIFRNYILLILYTKEFSAAEALFKYQFTGDLFKALSWVLGLWLIPRSKLIIFISLDLILNVNLIFIYYLLVNFFQLSLESVSISYLISYFIHFLLNLYFTRRLLKFYMTNVLLKLFFSSVAVVISITFFTLYEGFLSYVIILILLVIWVFLNFRKSDFTSFKSEVYDYFKK